MRGVDTGRDTWESAGQWVGVGLCFSVEDLSPGKCDCRGTGCKAMGAKVRGVHAARTSVV